MDTPRRRLAVTLALACAALVTVATSPPHMDFPGLEAEESVRAHLDSTTLFATHFTVRLAAEHNGPTVDGGQLEAFLSASASGCLLGIDTIDDAGTCVAVADFNDRPRLELSYVFDGADGGPTVAGSLMQERLFKGCPVGSACEQGVTFKVSLAKDETRPTAMTLQVRASAQGGTVDRTAQNGLTLTQP